MDARKHVFVSPLEQPTADVEMANMPHYFGAGIAISRPKEIYVQTDRGQIHVAVQGDTTKRAIVTYQDLGFNYINFTSFFNYVDMRVMLSNFCVYHVSAPGQEKGAPALPTDYVYPTMDELANQLKFVLAHLGIQEFIGLGVGVGANVLARFARNNPHKMIALALVNCTSTRAGWVEWGYQKLNIRELRSRGVTQSIVDYLIWHTIGRITDDRDIDTIRKYATQFYAMKNPINLAHFINSYISRTDLSIYRSGATLKVPVLNITGALSPHVEDTVYLNARLSPSSSTWMKVGDCGMVLDEQPEKMAEAFSLLLAGEGYVAPLSPTKLVAFRRLSDSHRRRACRQSSVIRITENPISEAVVC